MTWFKVDDKFHSHSKTRKVLAEDPAAIALWAVAGSWSSDNLTDGFVPDHQLPWLLPNGAEESARTLVAARLWRRVRGGYQFHEWTTDGDGTKRNPSREEVEAERRKKAEAGRKGGLASGKTRSRSEARASADASAPARRLVEPPTRPSPSKEGESGSARHASRGAARATPAATHSPSSTGTDDDPGNPDWRSMPAYGQAPPRRETAALAAARQAAAAAKPARAPRDGPSALERLLALPDHPDAPEETP